MDRILAAAVVALALVCAGAGLAVASGGHGTDEETRTYLLRATGDVEFAFEDTDDARKCQTNLDSTVERIVSHGDPRPRCVGARIDADGLYRVWVYYDLQRGAFGYQTKSLGQAPVDLPLGIPSSVVPLPRAAGGSGTGDAGTSVDCFECPPPYANHVECLLIIVGACLANPAYRTLAPLDGPEARGRGPTGLALLP